MANGHPSSLEPIGSPQLDRANVLSLQTLRSLGHFELNRLAFCQRTEARGLYCSVVNEYVTTTVCTADKSKTLSIVEPLNCSLFHVLFLVKLYVPTNAIWRRCGDGGTRLTQKDQIESYDLPKSISFMWVSWFRIF